MSERGGSERGGSERGASGEGGRKVRGAVFLSLDGVMQAPGGPSEDPTGGFAHGGWMPAFDDDLVGATIGRFFFSAPFDLLLGRRTYDIFASYWPFYEGGEATAIADSFNAAAKYVFTSGAPLDWQNSHRLPDIDALAAIKASAGPDLLIQGSSTLYPQLLAAGLLDEVTIMTFPVVLGGGKRLWGEGTPGRTLRMTSHEVSDGGVVVTTYAPAGEVVTGTFPGPEPSVAEQARQQRMRDGRW